MTGVFFLLSHYLTSSLLPTTAQHAIFFLNLTQLLDHTQCNLKMLLVHENKMEQSLRFLANAYNVYTGGTGRCLHERIKGRDREVRLSRFSEPFLNTSISSGFSLFGEVSFMNGDPYRYSHSVEQAIQIRFHPNNINRYSGTDIARAWTPTIRQHNCQSVSGQTAEGPVSPSCNEINASD